MGDACNIKSSYMLKQNIGLGNAQWKHKKVYVVLVYILFVIFYIIITISSPSLQR